MPALGATFPQEGVPFKTQTGNEVSLVNSSSLITGILLLYNNRRTESQQWST